MSARKSSHRTVVLIVSSGSPLALIASSLRSTSKKPFCPMARSLHPPSNACGHRVRFARTWREEFFEVPLILNQDFPVPRSAAHRRRNHSNSLDFFCPPHRNGSAYTMPAGASFTKLEYLILNQETDPRPMQLYNAVVAWFPALPLLHRVAVQTPLDSPWCTGEPLDQDIQEDANAWKGLHACHEYCPR